MNLTASGHGHVVQRLDGARARCGGPSICAVCQKEKAWWDGEKTKFTETVMANNISNAKPEVKTIDSIVSKLESLHAASTPDCLWTLPTTRRIDGMGWVASGPLTTDSKAKKDSEFIAAAHNLLPQVLAEIRRLRNENAKRIFEKLEEITNLKQQLNQAVYESDVRASERDRAEKQLAEAVEVIREAYGDTARAFLRKIPQEINKK